MNMSYLAFLGSFLFLDEMPVPRQMILETDACALSYVGTFIDLMGAGLVFGFVMLGT